MRVRRLMLLLGLAVGLVLLGATAPVWAYGDHNGDGTINLIDYAEFPACLAGPGGGLGAGCEVFNFHTDADVDLFDFAGFQQVFGTSAGVVIDTVPVGNPGNANDTEGDGHGGVDYVYNIATFEVTSGQYTEFLNAVADDDTYGLYNPHMWSDMFGCKIERTGLSPNHSYSVAPDWANRPVNYVSWGDAARLANWLHNGQPTGGQGPGTTEDGSYVLNGAISDAELLAVVRHPEATWVIPSEDEWYKAAYHKNDGITGNYWDYPTESNAAPTSEAPPGTDMTNGSADYYDGGYAIGPPYYRTEVGAYDAKPSDSPYNTFDQGGNVWEWNEAVIGSFRGLRGGSLNYYYGTLHAAFRSLYYYPTIEYRYLGCRVAEVPEPKPVDIDTVPVGNPGNADDTEGDGYGGVNYAYNIGKYEVTAGQYTEFLNAVAATDTYGLHNENMAHPAADWYGCNIQRSGSSGSYSYSVAVDWADRPVNYVSWGDAARFANWLHNGQPTGAQDLTTTEDGAYYLNGVTSDAALLAVVREPDATWVIPSEDEWYKAAYHYNDGVTGNYRGYPTESDTAPTSEAPPGTDMTNGSANYYDGRFVIGSPYYRTEVGAYAAKPSNSSYGTLDQGGNVWEWNEAEIVGSSRGLRGGSFISFYGFYLHASHRFSYYPTLENGYVGFRVVEVP